jgi:hypothetical protein
MISNCDDVRGMIPWLLNGTLDDDERRQVLQHLSTCESCRRDLADTRLAAEIFDQHPPAEAILALAWDETPQGIDPDFLEEHLASCPRCAAELELARMSRRLEEDDKVVPLARRTAPPAPATSWRGWKTAALAAGLAGVVAFSGWFQTTGRVRTLEEQVAGRMAAPAPAPPAAVSGESARVQQLAAELEERGKKIEQLEEQLGQVERQATELSGQLDQLAEARPATPAPQINAWAGTLMPGADVVRGNEPAGPSEIPGRTYATLLLTPAHPETHREHAVEIVDPSGKVVWTASGLARDADTGSYNLTLPPGALRAGSYTIRVYGLTDGRRDPVESYSIRVK